jgi:acetyl esterase/lipase
MPLDPVARRLLTMLAAVASGHDRAAMRDDVNAYARKLLAAGVAVAPVFHDGMIHNFHAIGAVREPRPFATGCRHIP